MATRTKRLTSWKKSARLKKSPTNSSSSGTVSRPVVVVAPVASVVAAAVGSTPPVEVWVSVGATPDCSALAAFWLAVACALFADSTAVPGAL